MKRTAYVGIIAFLTMGALAGHGHFTRAQAQEERGRERLDRGLRNIQDGGSPRPHHDAPLAAQAPEQVSVILIGTPDEAALADLGFRVITRTRDGVTARGPLATAPRLGSVPGVWRASLARRLEALLDQSLVSIRADGLRERVGDTWEGLTGKDVIVGIVDSGLDPDHPDFLKPDGSTRLLYYWDQGRETGPAPVIPPGETLFGTEWTASDIDNNLILSTDEVGHGTHVAGIAVGDGSASDVPERQYLFAGMAPLADIIFVHVEFTDANVVDAVRYIFARADELGRPAVVNLSLGTQASPHDGTSFLERGLTELTGPGRLIVASAGNDGIDPVHARLTVPPGGRDSASVVIDYGPQGPDELLNFMTVDAFYYTPDAFEVTLVSPGGRRFGPIGLGEEVPETATPDGTVSLLHWDADSTVSPNIEVDIEITNFQAGPAKPGVLAGPEPAEGTWHVVFQDLGSTGTRVVDLWIPSAFPFTASWTARRRVTDGTLTSPATAIGVLAAGGYNTKDTWLNPLGGDEHAQLPPQAPPEASALPEALTFFSSHGPTRDGRLKPDLLAPSYVVVSSLSDDVNAFFESRINPARTMDPTRAHYATVGTSMSSPHLAGALALLLEQEPDADFQDVQARIRSSSRQDSFTGAVWNARAGFGKLDVAALLDTTRTPVSARPISVDVFQEGWLLRWHAQDDDGVLGFRILSRSQGGSWIQRDERVGPGPHTWSDTPAPTGVQYRLMALERTGGWRFWTDVVPVGEAVAPALVLGPASPNPFRSETRLPLRVAATGSSDLEIVILDARGRRVRGFAPVRLVGDRAEVTWDGRTDQGTTAVPGMYWFRVRAGHATRAYRVVRLP